MLHDDSERIDPTLRGLNDPQRQAVESIAGPLLILAGPGSGKTRVISHRVAYLVRSCGVAPRRILAVTFTNKAARELKDRIERLIGPQTDQLTAGTFHSICARILRIEAEHAGIDPRFVIYDDDDQVRLMKTVLADLHLDEGKVSPRAVLAGISRRKAELGEPNDKAWRSRGYLDEIIQRAYGMYQERLADHKALDFDDLIMAAVRLLSDSSEVRQRYQTRYLYIMVDEFQDTNVAQYELVKLLAGRHRNLAVVGDPDQSIYRFRSADIRNILNFERDFPDAKLVRLEQNYRSTQHILDAAQGVIGANRQRKEKDLWTDNGAGARVVVKEAASEQDEARLVIEEIDRQVTKGTRRFSNFAIMYRTNAQSRPFEQAFMQFGIPYRLVGGTRFYERKEVKDILAYLRILHNPSDAVPFGRVINVPPRSIGQKTVDDLTRLGRSLGGSLATGLRAFQAGADAGLAHRAEQAVRSFVSMIDGLSIDADELSLPQLVQRVIERTGYRDFLESSGAEGVERWENVQQLVAAAGEYSDLAPREGLSRFLEEVALFTDIDAFDERADAVTLITLHAAKGLEFPAVFIVGLEDGILPHSRSLAGPNGEPDQEEMEEERRLLYVGMTRAKEQLFLYRAYRRTFWGRSEPLPASRFLDDLPPHTQNRSESTRLARPALPALGWEPRLPRPSAMVPATSRPQAPVSQPVTTAEALPFRTGDRVSQALLGDGVVVSIREVRGDLEVTVAFREPKAGIKRLLQSLARLEKV